MTTGYDLVVYVYMLIGLYMYIIPGLLDAVLFKW